MVEVKERPARISLTPTPTAEQRLPAASVRACD
jgi:hypothetical protein